MKQTKNTFLTKYLLISLILEGFILPVFSQKNQVETIKSNFENYQENGIQEKIFVHTDKDVYANEEIIWFKIYVLDGSLHQPLALSKVAYVEILDKKNKPVLGAKIELKDGTGNGSFKIPSQILSGNYTFRAYTSWMKNFSVEYFFEKPISIYNTQKSFVPDSISQKNEIEFVLFPEGGNLVNSKESNVAFKISQNGIGLAGNGVILDEKSDTIVRYSPTKFGIGTFAFKPESGKRYRAEFILNDGSKITKPITKIAEKGTIINVKEAENEQIKVLITSNSTSKISLFIHTRGILKAFENAPIINGKAEFQINKKTLGDGISHLTVFDENQIPVCERLYFKYPEKIFDIDLKLGKDSFETREQIDFNIETKSMLKTNISLAVYRLDSLQLPVEQNINNYVWLSSDLTGEIEFPDFYFSKKAKENSEYIDNLMLTHGWRRFRWNDILDNKKPNLEFPPEMNGHVIIGKTTKVDDTLASDIEAYLSVVGTHTQFKTAKSDSSGRIKFEMPQFYNQGEIVTQTKLKSDSLFKIEILSPFSEKYSKRKTPSFMLNEKHVESIAELNKSTIIQTNFWEDKISKFRVSKLDSLPFYTKPDITYLLDDYVRFPTVQEVLVEYVAPVMVRKKDGHFQLLTYDETRKKFADNNPLVLFDGVPVADIDHFMTYNPAKIKKLDVVSRLYYFSNSAFDGILNFTSNKGDLPDFKLDPSTTIIDYQGLQAEREFYSPQYDTNKNSRLPDFRNTLYWSPNIISSGQAKQSFFTSDLPGEYLIVTQGISLDGQTGFATKRFKVDSKKP